MQGLLFGMSQPQANEWVHRLTPFLNTALGHQQQLPARQPRDLEAVLGECEGLEFIIDGVERPIQRPKNPERQRQFYSGKKKRHSIKNNLIIDRRTRKIKGLSTTCEGKKHARGFNPIEKHFANLKKIRDYLPPDTPIDNIVLLYGY